MRNWPDAEADSAPGLNDVPWVVTDAAPLANYTFPVRFVDGTKGIVDLSRLLLAPTAGVFAVLRDPARFAELRVDDGVVTWPGGLDLAPDAMYDEVKAAGRCVVDPFPGS